MSARPIWSMWRSEPSAIRRSLTSWHIPSRRPAGAPVAFVKPSLQITAVRSLLAGLTGASERAMINRSAQQAAYSLFSVALLAASLHPTAILAWGTESIHWRLADEAVDEFNSSQGSSSRVFSTFLQQELDLPKGLDEPLAVQLGFDEAIDKEIGPINRSRLNRSKNLTFFPKAPDDVYIYLNQRCSGSPDPDCFSNLKRVPIAQLIRAGTWAEDNPNPRARHHFHDPTFEHSPPPGNNGVGD